MPRELLSDIAVSTRIPNMEPIFTYRVPHHLHGALCVGQLVWVPLRNQFIQGIVLNLYTETDAPPSFRPDPGAPYDLETYTIRNVDSVVDPDVALTLAQIRVARWLSEYYRFSFYEALALMLPPGVSQEMETVWRASPSGMTVDLGSLPERERSVLYFLRQQGETLERELRKSLRGRDSELRGLYNSLQERGFVVRGVVVKRPKTRPRIERFVRVQIPHDQLTAAMLTLERAPRQKAVLAFLQSQLESADAPVSMDVDAHTELLIPLSTVYAATGATIQAIRALERKDMLDILSREVRRDPLAGDYVPPDIPPPLTRAQERIWQQIAHALEQGNRERSPDTLPSGDTSAQFLLHGVTGSGKTELYLRAIGWVLRHGQQALVLVPEIALTAQLVRRFAARFPGQLAVLHSNLSLGERYDEWRRLRHGEAMIAIGSRSAAFAPLPNLGLIIVDEEHESSYKHDSSPRYHARDVARKLAAYTGSVIILGSATPSVESYHATEIDNLTLLSLTERVGMTYDARGLPASKALPLPPVRIIDMRHELQDGNRSIFSRALQDALQQVLDRQEQTILFLNRRGAAAFVMCRDCGHVVTCANCSSPLTPHYAEFPEDAPTSSREQRSNSRPDDAYSVLICHGCNHQEMMPLYCPQCLSPRIRSFGIGTQRVVEEIEKLFPGVRALRWDRDTVSQKGAHTRMLDYFLNHEADVLVGTQMIAKGLDLPLVSLVGVVAADTGLYLPDFRAGERTFQLLTQVAGRAGRRGDNAQVIIQTYSPDHYALRTAQEHDYHRFYTEEIAFRKHTRYPPYSRLIRLIYTSGSDEQSQRAAMELVVMLEARAIALNLDDWGIIGPAPAFFHKQRNRYRWHILLRAVDPTAWLETLQLPPGWVIDVDPVHVL